MAYASVNDVAARINRSLSDTEIEMCGTMLDDAAVIIDAYNSSASDEAKLIVSCRMVIRALGDGSTQGVPLGATQGTMSALGYSQSWTIGASGSAGELYIGKTEKKLLGAGERIGASNPLSFIAGGSNDERC